MKSSIEYMNYTGSLSNNDCPKIERYVVGEDTCHRWIHRGPMNSMIVHDCL